MSKKWKQATEVFISHFVLCIYAMKRKFVIELRKRKITRRLHPSVVDVRVLDLFRPVRFYCLPHVPSEVLSIINCEYKKHDRMPNSGHGQA